MLLFRSEEHVDRWCQLWGQPRGEIFSAPQAWRLAQQWYQADRRDPRWRRKTVDEAEATFAQLGFTSEFWRLR
jgi:Alkylmercury lyase